MKNVITDRIAFFLRGFHPFTFLSEDRLEKLSGKITVRYCKKDEQIFSQGDVFHGHVYILRQGKVSLHRDHDGQSRLVDHCDEGDVFGVRSFLTGRPYELGARAVEDCLFYLIKEVDFRNLIEENPDFSLFFASGYAAGQVIVRRDKPADSPLISSRFENQKLRYSRDVLTCGPQVTIREAAKKMSDKGVGSIVIVQGKTPIGIITDTDFRNKVLAKGLSPDSTVAEVMSSPVLTKGRELGLTEAIGFMLKNRLNHLVITTDGTTRGEVCGIVSDRDLIVSQQNHPAALLKALMRSNEVNTWAQIRQTADDLVFLYLEQEVNIEMVCDVITTLNDVIIQKAIELAISEIPEVADVPFCWLNLGSEGRGEQLLRTDQDNAIVFADCSKNEHRQGLLLKMAERVTDILERCGFEKCPAKIMASNPSYCQPLSKWKET